MPEWLERAYASLTTFWLFEPGNWDFWREWYEGMLAGRPLDWDLQKAVIDAAKAWWGAL